MSSWIELHLATANRSTTRCTRRRRGRGPNPIAKAQTHPRRGPDPIADAPTPFPSGPDPPRGGPSVVRPSTIPPPRSPSSRRSSPLPPTPTTEPRRCRGWDLTADDSNPVHLRSEPRRGGPDPASGEVGASPLTRSGRPRPPPPPPPTLRPPPRPAQNLTFGLRRPSPSTRPHRADRRPHLLPRLAHRGLRSSSPGSQSSASATRHSHATVGCVTR